MKEASDFDPKNDILNIRDLTSIYRINEKVVINLF